MVNYEKSILFACLNHSHKIIINEINGDQEILKRGHPIHPYKLQTFYSNDKVHLTGHSENLPRTINRLSKLIIYSLILLDFLIILGLGIFFFL